MTDAELIERLRHGVTWSNGKLIGAVVGEANDPIMREAADRLEAIANKLQRMEEALRFYADEWEQDVDAEQTVYGWVGSIGEVLPTNNLMADLGATARAALKD